MPSSPGKKFNLHDLHENETSLQRYKRLTLGENRGTGALLFQEIIFLLFSGLSGLLGYICRRLIYPAVFKGFSRSAVIGRHLTLRCPANMKISANVVIDDFVQLVADSGIDDAISLGKGSFVRSYAQINAGPPEGFVRIGENSTVGQATLIYGNGGVTIGNQVMIAGQCSIIASSHVFDNPDVPMIYQGYEAKGINIADNVWVGTGVRILDGVSIGAGAIIGANAVVNRDVAAGARVAGVPARELTVAVEK